MKKNVGITDRIIRFVTMDLLIGASISGIEFLANLTSLFLVLSLVLLFSIVTGYSLIYQILGINTLDSKPSSENNQE